MKFAVQLCVFLMALSLGGEFAGLAAQVGSGHVRVSGREYIRLNDWARANKFTVRWIRPGKTIQLSNHLAKIVLSVDPRTDRSKAIVNDVEVSLAFAMYYSKGVAYISQLDISNTLSPLLSPPKNARGIRIKTICIDPGHGGKDPGYLVNGHHEETYTLLMARELQDVLQDAGFKVVLTRTKDTYVELETRPELARKHKADLFISLHFNAFPRSTAVKGIETYCITPAGAYSSNSGGKGNTRWVRGNQNTEKNMLFAYQVQRSLVKNFGAEDRGVKRARFKVLADAAMPAILIEGGFMSNPTDGKHIFSSTYRKKMARAIKDGILAYKKAVNG